MPTRFCFVFLCILKDSSIKPIWRIRCASHEAYVEHSNSGNYEIPFLSMWLPIIFQSCKSNIIGICFKNKMLF